MAKKEKTWSKNKEPSFSSCSRDSASFSHPPLSTASRLHICGPVSQKPKEKEEPAMIKLIHIEPDCLFVCTWALTR